MVTERAHWRWQRNVDLSTLFVDGFGKVERANKRPSKGVNRILLGFISSAPFQAPYIEPLFFIP